MPNEESKVEDTSVNDFEDLFKSRNNYSIYSGSLSKLNVNDTNKNKDASPSKFNKSSTYKGGKYKTKLGRDMVRRDKLMQSNNHMNDKFH